MSDALQKLIKSMEAPLGVDAIEFLKLYDRKKPEFFTAEFIIPQDPFQTEDARFRFELVDVPPRFTEFNIAWSPKLEAELYKRNIKMSSPEQEAFRGGYLLLSNLRFPGIKFGEDYTNGVLIEVIQERFGGIKVIADMIKDLREYKPSRGVGYLECKNYLKSAVDGYGNSLVMELKYTDKTAFAILMAAIVVLLDRRFRISLRQTLFPKS